ncbi:MAG: flagellar motor protein MotB, partial [Pseudomonadota bacterium]
MSDHELIIIKRHEEDEHESHSSAWKVAHADFMTAMMAFFLIMWLINVTDQDVRKAIANYFNPVNLADNLSPRRGLGDPSEVKDEGTSEDGEQHSALKNTVGPRYGQGDDLQQGAREKALFQDPYATLAQIAAEYEPTTPTSADVPVGELASDASGKGEVHRDPFDPVYWQLASATKPATDVRGNRQNAIHPPNGTQPDAAAARPDGPAPGQPAAGKP